MTDVAITADRECVIIRISDKYVAEKYAETLDLGSRLAFGRSDVGFAGDAVEIRKCIDIAWPEGEDL